MIRMIIISKTFKIASDWLYSARLPSNSNNYVIIKDESDCNKLLGYELKEDLIIARVGDWFDKIDYILNFIESRKRK